MLEKIYRPLRMYTTVEAHGVTTINGIWIGNTNHLLQPVDAWFFSRKYGDELYQSFLREHGLTNASAHTIQRYVDDNEISLPDPHRIHLQTIELNMALKVTGTGEQINVAFIGETLA